MRPFSIVIAREGGRSSTSRAASSGTASLRSTLAITGCPASAGHDSREAYARPRERTGNSSAQGNRALRLGDELVRHLAEALDLGLHHVADVDERVGALADAAAGAAHEDVAGLHAENIGGVFDLLLGREDELRGVAVLLDRAVEGEADE